MALISVSIVSLKMNRWCKEASEKPQNYSLKANKCREVGHNN